MGPPITWAHPSHGLTLHMGPPITWAHPSHGPTHHPHTLPTDVLLPSPPGASVSEQTPKDRPAGAVAGCVMWPEWQRDQMEAIPEQQRHGNRTRSWEEEEGSWEEEEGPWEKEEGSWEEQEPWEEEEGPWEEEEGPWEEEEGATEETGPWQGGQVQARGRKQEAGVRKQDPGPASDTARSNGPYETMLMHPSGEREEERGAQCILNVHKERGEERGAQCILNVHKERREVTKHQDSKDTGVSPHQGAGVVLLTHCLTVTACGALEESTAVVSTPALLILWQADLIGPASFAMPPAWSIWDTSSLRTADDTNQATVFETDVCDRKIPSPLNSLRHFTPTIRDEQREETTMVE
ncbi:hypothetical protein EYF80_049721 [Liparis tanakae]|uniref:Uncharacterized protein n=1 Tax=Liparis tanakae TaxID=230148 RepID=A0A4Z2FFX8_9TELE|nr:hypothetical protein EYF80_049721 [Liparis tanakae]